MSELTNAATGQRIVVETYQDMPDKLGGLPLGSILERHGSKFEVAAFGEGGTWGLSGLAYLAPDMRRYTAVWPEEQGEETQPPVHVTAIDIAAALQWLGHHFFGPFDLFVDPEPVFLGRYE